MTNINKRIIAKYAEGDPGFFEKVGKSLKNFGQGVADKFKGTNMGDVMGAAAGASQGIANSMGIEQSKAGSVISGIGSVVSMIPGWGQIAGPAIQMLGNFTGGGGSVDENTGEVQKSSGLTRLFGWGRSDASLFRKSNRIKNTKVAKAQTENIQADYYNNPNVEVQPNVLAAEGGIMRRPVDALVSKGELIYDPTTKKLRQVPGSKGKPNRADDVFARLYEGDVVISNSPTMLMANGKTPAQNLMGMVDKYATGGTVKAREAIIKKVVNWQEANKTKPQQYAMYDEGTPDASPNATVQTKTRIKKYPYNPDITQFSYWDKERGDYKKEYLDWVNSITDQDVKDIYDGKYGDMSQYLGKNKGYIPSAEEARRLMTDKKYGNWHKIGQIIKDTELPEDELDVKIKPVPILPGVEIKDDPLNIKLDPTIGQITGIVRKPKKTSDMLYKAASILTPLSDYAEPEAVNYETSIAKFRQVNVNELDKLRAINENYSLDLYNASKLNTSTGQRLAYASQSATNRMKQISDVYSWKTNAQNQLIGQNVDTYNKWSADYAGIMNNVYDKAAANRAAARNINRQNRATALKNWGSILRNDKQYAMDRVRMEALDPMMKYGYQNDAKLKEMLQELIG